MRDDNEANLEERTSSTQLELYKYVPKPKSSKTAAGILQPKHNNSIVDLTNVR